MNLALAILLGSVPGFIWLVFYTHEDFRGHRHRSLTALSFLVGALSTFAVFFIQVRLSDALPFIAANPHGIFSFAVLGGVEEIMKFAAFFFFIRPRRIFQKLHEPIDAMVAMVAVALGFATIENIASVSQILRDYGFGPSIFETIILRFLGATLLHTLSSALVGYYWAKAALQGHENMALYFKSLRSKFIGPRWAEVILSHRPNSLVFVQGLLLATFFHALFNYLIIVNGPTGVAIIFLVGLAFFVLSDFEKLKRRIENPSPQDGGPPRRAGVIYS